MRLFPSVRSRLHLPQQATAALRRNRGREDTARRKGNHVWKRCCAGLSAPRAESWYLGGLCVVDLDQSHQEWRSRPGTSCQGQHRFQTLRDFVVSTRLHPLQFEPVVPFSLGDGRYERCSIFWNHQVCCKSLQAVETPDVRGLGQVESSSRKMRNYWRESSGGLQGWWGDWSISPTRRGWGSWACSAWRREGWEGTL